MDPLNDIFVDKNEPVDKKILVEIIKPYATIDKEGIVNFTDEYEKLTESKKTLVYLCCKKAMILREIPEIDEGCGPKEISEKARVSLNGAKQAVSVTYKKILGKDSNGTIIPNYNLKKVKDILL